MALAGTSPELAGARRGASRGGLQSATQWRVRRRPAFSGIDYSWLLCGMLLRRSQLLHIGCFSAPGQRYIVDRCFAESLRAYVAEAN